jgi:hypothetical protein
MDSERLSHLRRRDEFGLTTRERQLLVLTDQHPDASGKEMGDLLGISKVRAHQIRRNLVEKGMLSDFDYRLTDRGKEVISA